MQLMPMMVVAMGALVMIGLLLLAFAGPSPSKAGSRRLGALRERHVGGSVLVEAQLRRITNVSNTRMDLAFGRVLPNPALLAKRLAMTGKDWTLSQYGMATAGITVIVALLLWFQHLPLLLAFFVGLAVGVGIPHFVVGFFIKRRINQFTTKFPDAIELLVRGLRSGLPISETMTVVGQEVAGPVGEEFRAVSDKMKIGRPIDAALQETADRLGTPEFQFCVITIAIQRKTGGYLT